MKIFRPNEEDKNYDKFLYFFTKSSCDIGAFVVTITLEWDPYFFPVINFAKFKKRLQSEKAKSGG